MGWNAVVEFVYLTAGREVERWTTQNNLADEGEFMVLDSFLRNQGHPSTFYLRLFNDVPVDTDALSSVTGEPGFTQGYAPQEVLRSATADGWPSITLDGGDYRAVSKQVTFDFTASTTVQYVILATTSSNAGKLISYAPLSAQRTLASGEQLLVTFRPKLG